MNTAKIRYKGISFEHNPETLSLRGQSAVKEEKILFGGTISTNRGMKHRVVKGKGVFLGEDCLEKYSALARLQKHSDSGVLSLPDTEPFFAFFTGLELLCDKTPDLVEYVFEFTEDVSKSEPKKTPYYYVCEDTENLWDVSYKHSVDMEELVRLNPDIRYINTNLAGIRVRIC